MTFTITWANIDYILMGVYAILLWTYAISPSFYRNLPESWLAKALPPDLLERIFWWVTIPYGVYIAFYYGFLTAHWPY